ncbi:MAG: hypothetical protein J5860_03285 [Clostridia bacterium]|nr:hypothetical protein [Clostridia bacterium]MBO4429239.1 hypothetical protein [Clostridia bacterium]
MKTSLMTVKSSGGGMSEALAVTENIGTEMGLDKKSVLRTRLLAEELFGMLRGIAGDVEATYWLEAEDKQIEMHMKADVKMTDDMKEQFLAASSSGKNYAAKGFMGKLKVMIADVLLSMKEMAPYSMVNTVSYDPTGGVGGETVSVWSMMAYKDEVRKQMTASKEARDAWDELEKSIVANIADDVKVKIVGKNVEIIVYKTF